MRRAFTPSGIVTLTTDFGHRGPFVGVLKGAILRRFPVAQIVDLTHEIRVHCPAEAGFWIERSYRYFPPGTVHLAVVDPGVGTEREVLLAVGDGHAFLAPDNGLLGDVIASVRGAVYRVDRARLKSLGIERLSATFHGRDLFAPLAAELAANRVAPSSLGAPAESYVRSPVEPPVRRAGAVHGTVVAVDRFGNLITNVRAADLAPFRQPEVRAAGHRIRFGRTYGEAAIGELLALIDSFDALEIAATERNAAERLGLGHGDPVVVVDAD